MTNRTSEQGLDAFIADVSRLALDFPLHRRGTRQFVLAFAARYAYIRLADVTNPVRFLRQMEGDPPKQFGTDGFRDALVDDVNPARHYGAFLFVGYWLPAWLALLFLWLWETAGGLRYGYWSQPDIRCGYVGLFHGKLVKEFGHGILPALIARDLSQRSEPEQLSASARSARRKSKKGASARSGSGQGPSRGPSRGAILGALLLTALLWQGIWQPQSLHAQESSPTPVPLTTQTAMPTVMPTIAVAPLPPGAEQISSADQSRLGVVDSPAKTAKMDGSLLALAQAETRRSPSLVQIQIRLVQHRLVQHRLAHAHAITGTVAALGGTVTGISLDGQWAQALIPPDQLLSLSQRPAVSYVRQPKLAASLTDPTPPAAPRAESVALDGLNAGQWHQNGHLGEGAKVGIIDTGFASYASLLDVSLPAQVTGKSFVDGESSVAGTLVHGTSVAEVVHGVAPGAELYLARIATNVDLQEAATWLIDQGVDVIVTSIGWYNLTPGDGSGEFADLVALSQRRGVLWVTAAGNERLNHWGGLFRDPDLDGYLNFAATQEVNFFGPSPSETYLIPAGQQLDVHVRWSDWTQVATDYDLLVVRWDGSQWQTIAASRNPQNGQSGQSPTESVSVITSGDPAPYGFLIWRDGPASVAPPNFDLFVPRFFRPSVTVAARSLTNLADVPQALTVGAVDARSPWLPQNYSSEGPTNGPGGSLSGGATKPDLMAYVNVATNSNSQFSGTSAAAPHVAGAAALLRAAYPQWTPGQVANLLRDRAVSLSGFTDPTRVGAGRLHLGLSPSALHTSVIGQQVRGEIITYTLSLINQSPITRSVVLENSLPANLLLTVPPQATRGELSVQSGKVSWHGEIPGDGRTVISYSGHLPADGNGIRRAVNYALLTEADGTTKTLTAEYNPYRIYLSLLEQ